MDSSRPTPASQHQDAQTLEANDPPGKAVRLADTWRASIEGPLRQQALEAALCVAERLSTAEQVLEIAALAAEQTIPVFQTNRHTPGETFGFPGVTLPFIFFARCYPTHNYTPIAHHYLRNAAYYLQQKGVPNLSLFYGLSGLAALTSLLSENGTHYRCTLASLNASLCRRIEQWHWQAGTGAGVSPTDYDVLSGASGILNYLLTIPSPDADILTAISMLLDYLVWLAGTDEKSGYPHWYVLPDLLLADWQRELYPEGKFDCGMAHGISGPLAMLSQAWMLGHRRPGMQEAISTLSHWLMRYALLDSWGMNWPAAITPAIFRSGDTSSLQPVRASWCYGTPGVARALWLAGSALEDAGLRRQAVQAIEGVFRRPSFLLDIENSILCHGKAGLLIICLHFAQETGSPFLRAQIPFLVSRMLEDFHLETPLGFQVILHGENVPSGSIASDNPGWLNGATGAALALLAAATDVPPEWSHFLCLA